MNATIANNLIPVVPSDRGAYGRYLTVDVPNGWDDVKRICTKVLRFEGVNYSFTGWNSDRNQAFFRANTLVAEIR